jgi:hypothetical protein
MRKFNDSYRDTNVKLRAFCPHCRRPVDEYLPLSAVYSMSFRCSYCRCNFTMDLDKTWLHIKDTWRDFK